jgi:hypothetical protein
MAFLPCLRADARLGGEPQHVVTAVAAEFQQLAATLLLRAVLRARDAGNAGQAGEDRVPELVLPRLQHVTGNWCPRRPWVTGAA